MWYVMWDIVIMVTAVTVESSTDVNVINAGSIRSRLTAKTRIVVYSTIIRQQCRDGT